MKSIQLPDCLGYPFKPEDEDAENCHGDKSNPPCALRSRCQLVEHLANVTLRSVQKIIDDLKKPLSVPFQMTGTIYDRPTLQLSIAHKSVAFMATAEKVAKLLDKKLYKWPTDNWQPNTLALLNCHWPINPERRKRKKGKIIKKINPNKARIKETWKKNVQPELWYKPPFTGVGVPLLKLENGHIYVRLHSDELPASVELISRFSAIRQKRTPWSGWAYLCPATFENSKDVAELVVSQFPTMVGKQSRGW